MLPASKSAVADLFSVQVNVPKTRRTYCKGKDCKKHTQHKVTQYKAGKVREDADRVEPLVYSYLTLMFAGLVICARKTSL